MHEFIGGGDKQIEIINMLLSFMFFHQLENLKKPLFHELILSSNVPYNTTTVFQIKYMKNNISYYSNISYNTPFDLTQKKLLLNDLHNDT